MRTIKFRAWFKDNRTMSELRDLQSLLLGFGNWSQYLGHIEIMQFTGLFDKNGIEIYEMDILMNWAKQRFLVVFDEEEGRWKIKCPGDDRAIWFCELEKVGNFYENPELISN